MTASKKEGVAEGAAATTETAPIKEASTGGSVLFAKFKTDDNKEVDGIWYTPANCLVGRTPEEIWDQSPRFLIARYGGEANVRFQRAFEGIARPIRKAIDERRLSYGKSREIAVDTFLASSLLDWENVADENGKNLKYNKDNARRLFEKLPDLFGDLLDAASDRDMFRDDPAEGDAGN